MKKIAAVLSAITVLSFTAEAAPKKKAPAAKSQPSVKDLAIAEARKCDKNNDGTITGSEVTELRSIWPRNPKSWLYLFDDNSNQALDEAEIAKIRLAPASKSKPAQQKTAKQAPKKKK